MKKMNLIAICNYACVVLMLAMVVLQFMPYWGDVSIQGFVWLPEANKDLMKTVTAQIPDFDMNDIALIPFIILVGGLFGAVKCALNAKEVWNALFPFICGLCGVIALLTHPVYALGEGMMINLIVSAVTLLVSAYPVIRIVPEITKNFTE